MVEKLRPDPIERERIVRDIRRERRQELAKQLEVVVEDAIAYRDERRRDDNAHKARLQKRRDRLEDSIRRARELMHDWPIIDEDIELHRLRRRSLE